MLVAPDVIELVGGEHDGEDVYPFLTIDLSELSEEFDETPEMTWHTMHDELWVNGKIDGENAFVIFRRTPFSDVAPTSHVFDGNKLREKRSDWK